MHYHFWPNTGKKFNSTFGKFFVHFLTWLLFSVFSYRVYIYSRRHINRLALFIFIVWHRRWHAILLLNIWCILWDKNRMFETKNCIVDWNYQPTVFHYSYLFPLDSDCRTGSKYTTFKRYSNWGLYIFLSKSKRPLVEAFIELLRVKFFKNCCYNVMNVVSVFMVKTPWEEIYYHIQWPIMATLPMAVNLATTKCSLCDQKF